MAASNSTNPAAKAGSAASAAAAHNPDPPSKQSSNAPLPSDAEPFTIACSCLNVTICATAPNNVVSRANDGPKAFANADLQSVWLPPEAEKIRHIDMATFEPDLGGGDAWRKCWVCHVRVYRAKGAKQGDIAPADAWVDVKLDDGVLFGDALDEARAKTPLLYSGLVLDLPKHSTFGRPPVSATPVIYGPTAADKLKLLPPIPDPFFLPPPFIPNHPALRDMCKAAVASLIEKRSEIEHDIADYISKRTQDLRRLEGEVRAEVEALWDRYADGPGAGEDTQRRRSASISRDVSPSVSVARQHFDKESRPKVIPTTDIDTPDGVTHSIPTLSGAHNQHTAVNNASLLAASLSANAFHAPPPAARKFSEDDFNAIAKTVNDSGVDREVAMSFAFSTLEEHAAAHAGRREKKREVKVAEEVEEEQEDEEKGVDSWIGLERAQARRTIERRASRTEHKKGKPKAANEESVKDKAAEDGAAVANGEKKPKDSKSAVRFQEPQRNGDKDTEIEENGEVPTKSTYEDDIVFDMDGDEVQAVEQPEIEPSGNVRVRTMVEDNLSRTFAADAPSHRAAWRRLGVQPMASVLRRQNSSDTEDDVDVDLGPGFAQSVPVNIVLPQRGSERSLPMQRKTSLTDRSGTIVPSLMVAMRERSSLSSSSNTPVAASPDAHDAATRGRSGSIAIAPSAGAHLRSVSGTRRAVGGRRDSRTVSGEREREQVKNYGADPGPVFETMADNVADSDDESEAADDGDLPLPDGARFVPPHVLAQKASKSDVGWRSLA